MILKNLSKLLIHLKKKNNKRTHNATKIFQALRIFVNQEISELIKGLIKSVKILDKDGIIALVSFHSLEDKIVKTFFKLLSENNKISRYMPDSIAKLNILKVVKKKPTIPSDKEIKINKPSRSAKLRYAIKINAAQNFESAVYEKFKFLTDIEKLSEKL